MIFDHKKTQALLRAMKQYREWVADCEEQAEEKTPEIAEGLQKIQAAEEFIAQLDAEVTERAKGVEYRINQAAEFDLDDYSLF